MIDLRSDTVTRPTDAMREAMAKAEVGDDGYGDDPSVNALERKAAAILGKEAAILVPTGTMGNLCAILAQTGRGDEIIVESGAHIYRSELGGSASVAGIPHRVLPSERGAICIELLRAELQGTGGYAGKLRPALICVETTHNAAGGAVLPLDYLEAVREVAVGIGSAVHMDGARVFNAAVALSVDVSEIARHADTVTFCLSKGLSAPVGSVLCGSQTVIERARQVRTMLGGTMRQAGILAAAGIVALDTMVERLVDDHRRARRLAEGLHAINSGICDPGSTATNILFADISASNVSASEWCRRLAMRNITCRPYSGFRIRLLTHAGISDEDVELVLSAFAAEWHGSTTQVA
ncbi:beta-eliminating lyase-related protein [Mesorhizobium sp. M0340]|uniref:GntG family PLP-dependent aldolase n=1 Tax=Mesorhizobium sp. M0340 TaxID=2956939 RepID=UPI00333B5309